MKRSAVAMILLVMLPLLLYSSLIGEAQAPPDESKLQWISDADHVASLNAANMTFHESGYTRETVTAVAEKACTLSYRFLDLVLQEHYVLDELEGTNEVQDGLLVLSPEQFNEFLNKEMDYLQTVGLSELSECVLRSILWRTYYSYPDGIPIATLSRSEVEKALQTICSLPTVLADDRLANSDIRINWLAGGEGLIGASAGLVTAGADVPILSTPIGIMSAVAVPAQHFSGLDVLEYLSKASDLDCRGRIAVVTAGRCGLAIQGRLQSASSSTAGAGHAGGRARSGGRGYSTPMSNKVTNTSLSAVIR